MLGPVKSYERQTLSAYPRLGDVVLLLTGGPSLIVVDVKADCERDATAPFGAPVGVLYADASGRLHRLTVPFGSLSRA